MHNVVINSGSDGTSAADVILVLGILFLVVVMPIVVVMHYRHRGGIGRPNPADQAAATELWDRARRMETRIEYLERVLDAEMPGWRSRS